jgi:hypothetical protein
MSIFLKRLTVRMPQPWRGQVTDARVWAWLRSIPGTLPPDPGGGTFRRSFALSTEAWELVKRHPRKLQADPSAWLRRLIAAKLSAPVVAPSPAMLPSGIISRLAAPGRDTAKPVPTVRRTARADLQPYREDQGKKDFQKYIAGLEAIVRSGKPEAGEAQVRLARIREIQAAQQLVDADPDSR